MNNKIAFCLVLVMITMTLQTTANNNEVKAQGGTGFKINDIRIFESNDDTVFKEDGQTITGTRAQGGTGYKIRYKASEINPNVTSGILDEVELVNIYMGPVVSTSPLKVFDIEALTTNDTYLVGFDSISQMALGDEVKVSGFFDAASRAIITRIEKVAPLSEWKLSGYATAITNNQFKINEQVINYLPNQVSGCGAALDEGELVEVQTNAQNAFDINSQLDQVISIQCIDENIANTESTVIIEGMIDAFNGDDELLLSGQVVNLLNNTRYIRGRFTDLQVNIKVEIEGALAANGSTLLAEKVRFLEPRFNLVLPVMPENMVNNQVNVAGVSMFIPPQFNDPEGLFTGGLEQTTQIKLRGYDQSGQLYLTQVNAVGNVNFDEVSANGLVTLAQQPELAIFGVSIDTTDAAFFDQQGDVIGADDFFALVTVGAELELEFASLDIQTGLIQAGQITLVELPEKTSTEKNGNESTVVGIGTLTSLPDAVFQNSFE